MKVVAIVPHGLEEAACIELSSLGAQIEKKSRGSISLSLDLACFYRINLQSRLPFRFLREIAQFFCNDKYSLYSGVQHACDWSSFLNPSKTFRVDVSGFKNELNHTHFTALQVKNAIIDLQRELWGERSNVNLDSPDFCIHLYLSSNYAILSLATSSTSLHRRGYKSQVGIAPLKENLAAGLIQISNWNDSLTLVDPLCGSATFLLEAASIARGIAPGIEQSFLFQNWPDFDQNLWNSEKRFAKKLFSPYKKLPKFLGCENNLKIANQAQLNIMKAGLEKEITIQTSHFKDLEFPSEPGVIICNPPYGERLGNKTDLEVVYHDLGQFLKKKASGWDFWMLNGNPALSQFLGMKSERRFPISNGGIDCRFLHYKIH
ncbi:THUMP domain-containing class I SAM-dependent RNA methyltransferase [Prochlorococcus marinus]|uniref:THUMP domain-containing class I SAM-dependent RNA methyltransferase n=1 Tax=Prochlorococcus marinus TaxID=1219 RepID=UPI0022B5CC46|nr:class I SAM-dependent RNA methyltransferase [Prochlorococcus marinus]